MRKRNLKCRIYTVKGPNHLWHADGNDKLKRYGFCIYGCIDGFSRKVIWLSCTRTNKDPILVASDFLKSIAKINAVPKILRLDRETEKTLVADIQMLLRSEHDDSSKEIAALFGSTNHNQRIEGFWGCLRKAVLQTYIDFFSDLIMGGLLDTSSPVELECLAFCFLLIWLHKSKTGIIEYARQNQACYPPAFQTSFITTPQQKHMIVLIVYCPNTY
ncbi:MAG: hypothetical protein AAGC93_21535, partial [Cyanobacteria bacterium P01_F01_bin.53]